MTLKQWVPLLLVSFVLGCNEGDVRKVFGTYEVTVVNPKGTSAVGQASVTNSGSLFSFVIHSGVGDFAFNGGLTGNNIEVTYTDSSGGTVTAKVQFSVDRSTFTASIQTSAGLYVVRGMHL